jgi:hypothetical protein
LYPRLRPARVTITTARGKFVRQADEALGSRLVPLDDAGLTAKFHGLVAPVLGAGTATDLAQRLWTIDSLDNISIYFSEVQAGDRVRVRYVLAQGDYPSWPSIQRRIRELCEHEDFVLDSVVPLVNREATPTMLLERPRVAVATDEQILKSYCRCRDLDAKVEQQGVELL